MSQERKRTLIKLRNTLGAIGAVLILTGLAGLSLLTWRVRWCSWYEPVWPWQIGAGVVAWIVAATLLVIVAIQARCVHCGLWVDPHLSSPWDFTCPRCGKDFNVER